MNEHSRAMAINSGYSFTEMGLCVCVCILQGAQLLPKPLTLEPPLDFLPRLLLSRRCPRLRPPPGRQAALWRPVTTPWARLTPTWPPRPWWLQPGRGFHHSVEETTARKASGRQPFQKDVKQRTRLFRTHSLLHFVLLQALVRQKPDPSVKECHPLFMGRIWMCDRHQRGKISALFCLISFLLCESNFWGCVLQL